MPVRGTSRKYFEKYLFRVEIDGRVLAAFTKVGPLEAEVEDVEIDEGGDMVTHTQPGKVSFTDIVCEYGETDNLELYNIYKQVFNSSNDSGEDDEAVYKHQFQIHQLNRKKAVVATWVVYDGYVKKYSA